MKNPRDKVTARYVKGKAQFVNESKKRKRQFCLGEAGDDDSSVPKRTEPQKQISRIDN